MQGSNFCVSDEGIDHRGNVGSVRDDGGCYIV